MYNNQPMNNGQQGQYEKNPNGGYLNKSNYGQDSWYGKVAITPELLREIQQTGFVNVQVKDIQTTQYGECRRVIAKPYVPAQGGNVQGVAPAQTTHQTQPQFQPQPAAPVQNTFVQPQAAPAPVGHPAGVPADDIPF